MIQAFALAFRQLTDRALIKVFVISLAITLAIFVALGFALHSAIADLLDSQGWNDGTLAVVATVIAELALFWVAFRAIAIVVIGLFADQVVHAVEARHYPDALSAARPVSFGRAMVMGLKSAGRLIGYNLLAVPLYIVLLATGVGLPVAFFALNGWLLGRDLGDMVAARHTDRRELAEWRRQSRWTRLGAGLASAGLFAIPVVNLIAPVVGAAAMTHLFHQKRAPKSGAAA
jgi:uncharacterized protein involved in cysteine biosynthesis